MVSSFTGSVQGVGLLGGDVCRVPSPESEPSPGARDAPRPLRTLFQAPMPHGTSLPESLAGAFRMKLAILTPFLRRRRTTWGTTPEELQRAWPGDDLVPAPSWGGERPGC